MSRAEGVVLAFLAAGEAGEAAALAQRSHARAPAGQDLVRIALVADVPDQLVARRVEDVVDGHGQLDHAQSRTEVPARRGDGTDHVMAHLVRHLAQLLGLQLAKVFGDGNRVQKGRFATLTQRFFSPRSALRLFFCFRQGLPGPLFSRPTLDHENGGLAEKIGLSAKRIKAF